MTSDENTGRHRQVPEVVERNLFMASDPSL